MDPAPCSAGRSAPRDPRAWYQSLLSLVIGRWDLSKPWCSKSSYCSTRAPQTLPALGNKGRGEMGCLTWEWDTSWCLVSSPKNSSKAKTETQRSFVAEVLQGAVSCPCCSWCPQNCSLGALPNVRHSQNCPFVCCSLPVGLCHLSNLQETALPSL